MKFYFLLFSLALLALVNYHIELFDPAVQKRVIIVGTAKSGTTAVYKSIKDSMGDDTITFFEPDSSAFNSAIGSRRKKVLVKLTLIDRDQYKNLYEGLSYFDKKVIVIRDLRDILISNLLYNVRWMRFSQDPVRLEIFINALKKKEENPESYSVLDLYRLRNRLESEVIESWEKIRSWQDEYEDLGVVVRMVGQDASMHILHYEDYVDNKLDGVSGYLGLHVVGNADVHTIKEVSSIKKSLSNIARTKTYGNWKNWFTAEDVEILQPLFAPLMAEAGYDDEWTLNIDKTINAKHSSQYVLRIVVPKE